MRGPLRLVLVALALLARPAAAAELQVLTTGAFKPVLEAFLPDFVSRSGNQVRLVTDTAGGVASRVARGDPFDVAIMTPATAQNPERDGKVILVTPIASVGIGVAVRAGAPKPDLASVDAFKAAMLAAPSVAMVDPASGGSSGIYLAKLFDQLGITAQMKPKLVLTQGGLPAERIVQGQAVLAVGQTSELLAVRGVALAGPLPASIQQRTVYVAGLNPKAGDAPLILLAALASPEMAKLLADKGMGPP